MRVAAVVLAAGAGARMGGPKALLELEGEALVRRAARVAAEGGAERVVVVVGAEAERAAAALAGLPVAIVRHAGWAEGLASSLAAGAAAAAAADPPPDALLFLLCDQVAIAAPRIAELLAAARAAPGARVACRSAVGLGAPALFPRTDLSALLALRGDRGARSLLEAPGARVVAVEAPEAALDVDTPEAWRRVSGAVPPLR